MKLDKIFEDRFFVGHVEEVEVRFYEFACGCEPPIHTTSINLVELCKDWWDECNYCPENGTFIYAVEFNIDGAVYWMDNEVDFEFQTLMEEFGEHFPQYKPEETSIVSVKVVEYVNVEVKHKQGELFENIRSEANNMVAEINFGELENIDWDAQEIVG